MRFYLRILSQNSETESLHSGRESLLVILGGISILQDYRRISPRFEKNLFHRFGENLFMIRGESLLESRQISLDFGKKNWLGFGENHSYIKWFVLFNLKFGENLPLILRVVWGYRSRSRITRYQTSTRMRRDPIWFTRRVTLLELKIVTYIEADISHITPLTE